MTEYKHEYKWVKYRTRHSSGPSRWDYREMPIWGDDTRLERQLESFLRDLDYELNTDSEHWRGVEGLFEDPPAEVIERAIKAACDDIKEALEKLERLGCNVDPVTATKLRLII